MVMFRYCGMAGKVGGNRLTSVHGDSLGIDAAGQGARPVVEVPAGGSVSGQGYRFAVIGSLVGDFGNRAAAINVDRQGVAGGNCIADLNRHPVQANIGVICGGSQPDSEVTDYLVASPGGVPPIV